MNSKYSESKKSAVASNSKLPTDSCSHLISTSLRDLSKQYQDLSREKANFKSINKQNITEIDQETNSKIK